MINKHGRQFLRNSRGAQRYVGSFIVLYGRWLAEQANSDHMEGKLYKAAGLIADHEFEKANAD